MMTLFLMSICLVAVVESTGFNYYWPYPGSQDMYAIPQFAPMQDLWQPVENCDKKASMEEGSSESSSSESSSSESSSGESKESKESNESKESGEEKEEGEGSKEESKSSSEETEGSSEEGDKKEGSGEESGEGKEEPKKKKKKEEKESKPSFPSYLFPPRPAVVYGPSSSYAAMPYRTAYVLQRPATTYPVKSSYQYVLPTSSAVLSGYGSPVTYNRVISNPVAKLAYSAPTLAYPAITKRYIAAPSASVYSVPAASLTYIKK